MTIKLKKKNTHKKKRAHLANADGEKSMDKIFRSIKRL